ncbi:MAG: NAD-dependent epimerase/dehydratase family protein [Elusimicrobiota bacterium]
MRILVTGGAGFIGSHVVDAYINAGHKVIIVDDGSTGNFKQINKKAIFYNCDIRNKAKLAQLFSKYKFNVVNHHAAQIDVRKSVLNPLHDADINIIGLLNLLDVAVKNKVEKFIFSSSGGTIYGETPKPALETSPEIPLSPYGVAKLSSEKYIQAFSALFNIKYTIFRYSNVYGPRQNPHGEAGVVAIFSSRLLKNEPLKIFGSGNQTRDFVYVGDVARANLLALRKGNNQIINIGIGKKVSVNELFNLMAEIIGYQQKPVHAKARLGELQDSVLNYNKAKRVLGWKPKYQIKEGLAETILFFENMPIKK